MNLYDIYTQIIFRSGKFICILDINNVAPASFKTKYDLKTSLDAKENFLKKKLENYFAKFGLYTPMMEINGGPTNFIIFPDMGTLAIYNSHDKKHFSIINLNKLPIPIPMPMGIMFKTMKDAEKYIYGDDDNKYKIFTIESGIKQHSSKKYYLCRFISDNSYKLLTGIQYDEIYIPSYSIIFIKDEEDKVADINIDITEYVTNTTFKLVYNQPSIDSSVKSITIPDLYLKRDTSELTDKNVFIHRFKALFNLQMIIPPLMVFIKSQINAKNINIAADNIAFLYYNDYSYILKIQIINKGRDNGLRSFYQKWLENQKLTIKEYSTYLCKEKFDVWLNIFFSEDNLTLLETKDLFTQHIWENYIYILTANIHKKLIKNERPSYDEYLYLSGDEDMTGYKYEDDKDYKFEVRDKYLYLKNDIMSNPLQIKIFEYLSQERMDKLKNSFAMGFFLLQICTLCKFDENWSIYADIFIPIIKRLITPDFIAQMTVEECYNALVNNYYIYSIL